MSPQYWVQCRGDILGPFSRDELREMAAVRKILPHHKISTDQRRWIVASRMPGLMSIKRTGPVREPGPDATDGDGPRYLASTVDDNDLEYGLRPPEVETPPTSEPPDAKPAPPPLPVGSLHRLTIPQRQTAGCLGGLAGFMILVLSLPAAAVAGEYLSLDWVEYRGLLMLLVPLAGLLLGVAVVLLCVYGSVNTIDVDVQKGGYASVVVTRRFAYFTWSRRQVVTGPGDRLEKRIKQDLSGGYEPAVDYLLMTLLFVFSPGRFLFRYLFLSPAAERSRNMDRFRLLLVARESPAPLLLLQDSVETYFATRYGTPRAAEEIITLLRGAAPQLQVHEIEE